MTEVITHKRGASFTVTIQITDSEEAPVDLTGASIRSSLASDVARIDLACTILNPAEGLIQIAASATETRGWPLGEYDWDLAQILPGGGTNPWPVDRNIRLKVVESPTLRTAP